MPLTQSDLIQIKEVMRGELKNLATEEFVHGEIEGLAKMVAKGFESVDQRFEQVDQRFERLEGEVGNINARLQVIERDVAEIRRHFVYRDEFEDALARIALIEKKLGIESGKDG